MIRIDIIEAFDHTEVVWRWAELWAGSQELEVRFHLSARHLQQIPAELLAASNLSWVGPVEGEPWRAYLRAQSFTERTALILLTTGRRPEWFTPLCRHPHLFVVLHNSNYWLGRKTRLAWSPRNLWQHTRDFWFRRAKRQLLSHGTALVPFPAIQNAIQAYFTGKTPRVLPFSYVHQPTKQHSSTDGIHLVVPGTVDGRLRDYACLAEALQLLPAGLPPFTLHLAGRDRDRKVLNELKAKVGMQLIRNYPEGLSQAEFTKLLLAARLIIAPAQPQFAYGPYLEKTGETRISGAINDAIYTNKSLALPAWHPPVGGPFHGYRTAEELAAIIHAAIEDRLPAPDWSAYQMKVQRAIWTSLFSEQ